MKKSLLLSTALFTLSATGVAAFTPTFHDHFNNGFAETWYPVTYEANGKFDTACGTTSCGQLVTEGNDKFFRFELRTNAVFGEYSDTELREAPHDQALDNGPWTPTVGHPVVLESRLRYGQGHNYDGSGGAVGTSGVGFWNNAAGVLGPHPEYDAITFSWVDDDFTDLFGVDGFSAQTVNNLFPVHRARPAQPINMEQWNDLKFIWSVNEAGVQHVEYFVNGTSMGAYDLPVALQGLNVVVWQDNQVFTDNFEQLSLVPPFNQHMDVDYVKVRQLE